jgi:hypothetical protein
MSNLNIRLDLGSVDLAGLHTEDDYRREARRLLPSALSRLGEAVGKAAWDELQRSFKGIPGFKGNNSSSDRARFIREAGEEYKRKVNQSDKQKIEDNIVAQIKEQKSSAA